MRKNIEERLRESKLDIGGTKKQRKGGGGETHILPHNRTKARNPHNPRPTNLIHEQPFPRKHSLTEPLVLILLHHSLRARHEGIFAHTPLFSACQAQGGDVAEEGRRHEEFAGTCVLGGGHFAAGDEFFDGEFDGAFEGYGGGHGDHDACVEGEVVGLVWVFFLAGMKSR